MASLCKTLAPLEETSNELSAESSSNNQRIRGANKQYYYIEEFASLEEAIQFVMHENCWKKGDIKPSSGGVKHFYKCKKAKSHKDPCAVGCYIHVPTKNNPNLIAHLYKTNCK